MGKDDVSGTPTFTIDYVRQDDVKGEAGLERKAIMHFREPGVKPYILNTINWMTCEDAYGEESDDWSGKKIELYVDPNVMFGSKRVGGIRFRIPNGSPVTQARTDMPLMTYQEAVLNCKDVGVTEDELKAKLKMEGFDKWSAEACTPFVREIISNVKNRADDDEEIPF